eukprot:9361420-Karenia_brevis.AAC.1
MSRPRLHHRRHHRRRCHHHHHHPPSGEGLRFAIFNDLAISVCDGSQLFSDVCPITSLNLVISYDIATDISSTP